ncbi:MAG: alcohol dehydrogenase, class [Clostridia bacterium]|jgi:alcohol dehydrogenase class IV|nr:alcohol dehydrogenase, class [Clostridia bacterium]
MLWEMKKGAYRLNQSVMRTLSKTLKFTEPELLSGAGSVRRLPEKVKAKGISKVLVVTDKVLMGLGMLDGLLDGLKENNISYVVYNEVQPNPTIDNIESARKLYIDNDCRGVIAFGGGSSMDCAKTAAARVTNSNKTVSQMRGVLKIRKPLPPLFAVPTTAGTGSETTIAAVVTDPSTHEKYAIMDTKLVPIMAALDPELTIGLPTHITSTTGMDALTHAVEAYIGRNGTPYTDKNAEEAVKIIYENLEKVYKDGKDIEARNQMLLASYKAGIAFTRAYVGYVHAIAHTLGGLYGVPHGLGNAVVLPYILEFFGGSSYNKLAKLAVAAGLGKDGEPVEVLAESFIDSIKTMNANMNIPTGFKEIKADDVPLIVKRVLKEGNPGYPVPKIMNAEECTDIINKLMLK